MGDFIETGTLAGPMADAKPLPASANPNLIPNLQAARWNELRQALIDLRGGLLNGALSGITAENMYPDTATGLAAVAEGAYFTVPSFTETESLILYRKVTGTASEVSRYPSALVVAAAESAKTAAQSAQTGAEAARDTATAQAVAVEAARVAAEAAARPYGARSVDGNVASVVGASGVAIPSPFPATGIKFYRDQRGRYSTSFDPDAYLASWSVTSTIYVDVKSGNDTTGTGATGAPFKTVQKAITVAIAAADTKIQIVVKTSGTDVLFARDEFLSLNNDTKAISGKRIAVVPDDPRFRIYATTHQRSLVWTLAAGQTLTYQAARSGVTAVVDISNRDERGIPRLFERKTSIADVEATPGSWFQDSATVYVHSLYGGQPAEGRTLAGVSVPIAKVTLAASAELFLRNVYAAPGSSAAAFSVTNADGDYTDHRFVAWECAFAGANPLYGGGFGSNGLTLDSVKQAWIFNSAAAYNSADGCNFHYTRIPATPGAVRDYYALLFGCVSYDNGLDNAVAPGINNAFTSHEGAHIALVACAGWNTQGPLFANVNGCNSVLIGCAGRHSARATADATHAAFFFDQANAPAGVGGAAYLDDCEGLDTIWDLSTDGSALPITLRDFIGTKILPAAAAHVTYLPASGRAHMPLP
jgi:hypothetical protein